MGEGGLEICCTNTSPSKKSLENNELHRTIYYPLIGFLSLKMWAAGFTSCKGRGWEPLFS